ncbi:MAG: hypothetical protein WC223_01445 [Bacteroidales bacterium]|jgi:hypothetical protein
MNSTTNGQEIEASIRQIVRDEITLIFGENYRQNISSLQNFHFPDNKTSVFRTKIGWLKGDKTLLKLHELLASHGFISCDFKIFKSHFIGNEDITASIEWHTYTKSLVYLFEQLMVNGFIPDNKKQHQLLKAHFIDERGNMLKNEVLRATLNDLRNNKRIQVIENIIAELYKNFN